ncbi:MAG: FecR domain-containing protein, partial [Phenylobacterium sp.]
MSLKRAAIAGLALQALAAAPALSAEPVESYVVRPGDTLYELGRRYFAGGDYRAVQRLNRIADPRRLKVGSRLKVPARLLKVTPIEARVAGFRGAVTVTAGGRTLPVSTGMMLKEGAVVATGPNAFLRLDLPDGTHLSLPSQSRVQLGKMTLVEMSGVVRRDLQVQGGRLESDVTPLRDPRDSYTVRTPMSVSAVRGTEFRVAYDDQAARASTEVIEGVVAVTGDHQGATLAAAYGAVTTASGVSAPISLAAAPNLANPGRVQDEQAVRFQISAPSAALGYHVRLAADAGFVEVLNETASDSPDLALGDLPDGVNFLRLAAMDDNGLLGLPATYA